ncbi:Scarecrow-like protein 3 [Linum grandiflorum]
MTLQKPDVSLSLTLSPSSAAAPRLSSEQRGIRLIQLLLKCATHASSSSSSGTNLDLADACLSEISTLASISGDSMQRLASRFASALATRLLTNRWPGVYTALKHTLCHAPHDDMVVGVITLQQRRRSLFSQAFPYLSFTYAIIARTLLQAMTHERSVHLVDLDSGDSKLWVPLLRSFASLFSNGPPHLIKVTCVSSNGSVLEKLGQQLVKEAEVLGLSFRFIPLKVAMQDLRPGMIEVMSGEALAFISVLNLHVLLAEEDGDQKFGGSRMGNFLGMIRSMSPKALFVVEQEANHNSNRLVERVVEGLHYYSAVFDSIDSTFGAGTSEQEERTIMEEMFGDEIQNIVACEGVERVERHERYSKWTMRMSGAGFRPVRMWYNSDEEAKQMVDAFGKAGYKIVSDRTSMMICWHDRPLYALTTWTC